jgi:hypothetical protein
MQWINKVGPGPLPVETRKQLKDRVAACGEQNVVQELGLSRTTVARAVAGFDLQPATRQLIEFSLSEVSK